VHFELTHFRDWQNLPAVGYYFQRHNKKKLPQLKILIKNLDKILDTQKHPVPFPLIIIM
jgi:hypothetical protein